MEEKTIMLLAVLLVGVAVVMGMKSDSGSCNVDPSKREDCGWFPIDETTCKQKECCWDSSYPNKPYCYFSTAGPVPSCIVNPNKPKIDCGWLGIDQQTCEKRTCCWAQADPGTPWCYVKEFGKLVYGMCRTAPSERIDCAHDLHITKKDCLNRGCCYDNSYDDFHTPWCFYPPAPAGSCEDYGNTGTCKYVCAPNEHNHVYGKCSEGRWCCY